MSTLYSAPPDLTRQHHAPHNHLTVLNEKALSTGEERYPLGLATFLPCLHTIDTLSLQR